MPTHPKQKKVSNDLWMARKRTGLQQKHVAFLLRHKTTAEVSRYEKGLCVPGLRILLQLEIIYGTSVKHLYPKLYEQLRLEMGSRILANESFGERYRGISQRLDPQGDYCGYLELLEKPVLTREENQHLRAHVLSIMRHLAHL